MHGQWSNPVYAEPDGKPQIIFPGGDGWLRAFDPKNGDADLEVRLQSQGVRLRTRAQGHAQRLRRHAGGLGEQALHRRRPGPGARPGVGHLWCIDITKKPTNKDKDLSPVNDNFDPKAAENKDSGLVWHFGGDVPDGVEYPRDFYFGRTMSTCCVHDGLVYAAEYDGCMHCLDARTGKKYWEHDLKAQTWSSPYWVDGKVYLGNEKRQGHRLRARQGKKILAVNGNIRGCKVELASPVAANGVLYLMTVNPCKLCGHRRRSKAAGQGVYPMRPHRARGAGLTAGAALVFLAGSARLPPAPDPIAAPGRDAEVRPSPAGDWPMYGGTPPRNMVNTVAKDIPTRWSAQGRQERQVEGRLGDRTYWRPGRRGRPASSSAPTTASLATRRQGRQGVLMCFRESDGEFLWQITHDMPDDSHMAAPGRARLHARRGGRPAVLRQPAELICADVDGDPDARGKASSGRPT